jgi:hypothetical protein
MRIRSVLLPLALLALFAAPAGAQPRHFTHADSLRGSIGPARAWWDVTYYDLNVAVSPADSSVRGHTGITYRVLQPAGEMQIDLQRLEVDSIVQDGRRLQHRRDGDALFVTLAAPQPAGAVKTVTVHFHGKPRVARRAPWDGGFVRPCRGWAPARGGPTRTRRPTSPTASAWPSPCRGG